MTITAMIAKMSEGLGRSFAIFSLTLVFSLPLGLLVALLRMTKFKPVQWAARVFISILRGTPLMLQLLAVTYGPFYLFGAGVARNKLIPIIIAYSINYAAYFAEIYRGGIESMPVGQYEAAEVLGYGKFRTITLVKDTSMAFTVAYQEMFSIGKQIANSQTSFMPFLIAGVFYFAFNFIVATVMSFFEKRMSYYR